MARPASAKWNVVRLPAELMTRVDAWAGTQGKQRSEAIRQLVELALKQCPVPDMPSRDQAIERLAQTQIDMLIDPDTPPSERERRIHRLTEGPPEFVELRRDLARSKSEN
jgi:predicted DNA-binding protein